MKHRNELPPIIKAEQLKVFFKQFNQLPSKQLQEAVAKAGKLFGRAK